MSAWLLALLLLWPLLWQTPAAAAQTRPEPEDGFHTALPSSLSDWLSERKGLKQRFQAEIYGWRPQAVPWKSHVLQQGRIPAWAVNYAEYQLDLYTHVGARSEGRADGKWLRSLKLLVLWPDRAEPEPSLKAWPTVLFLNRCGNRTVLPKGLLAPVKALVPLNQSPAPAWQTPPELQARLCPGVASEAGWRGDFWALKEPLQHGLAVVTVHESDLAPDDPTAFAESVHSLPPSSSGLLSIWSWGLSEIMDFLSTLPPLDAQRIGLMGHSRRGKAALLTAALDERFAFVLAHQSGTLGAVPVQWHPEEPLQSITFFFPHWFTPALRQQRPEDLSLSQVQLLALLAPRPLLITEGLFDIWASPALSWRAANQAAEVYRLYGVELPDPLPTYWSGDTDLRPLQARLAYGMALHGHGMQRDFWQIMLAFLQAQGLLGAKLGAK